MDGEIISILIYTVPPAALLLVGWLGGRFLSARHEVSLTRRQVFVADIRLTDMQQMFDAVADAQTPTLVTSEVTLGIDHFRGFLGQLKSLLGGQVYSYQIVLDRARREAMMRLLEHARDLGYNAIANVRVDFANISGAATARRKASMVTILASGTAYRAAGSASQPISQNPVDLT